MIRARYQVSIRYRSSVDSSVRDRGLGHLQTPSTLDGVLMGAGRGQGRHRQSVYDIASALPGTTPVPSANVRSGRRTGTVITNRIVRGDVLDGGARPLRVQSHQGASVPLRVAALGLETDRGRYTVFRRRQMSVISTLHCRCLKLLPHGTTPRRTHVVDGNKVPVQKSR